MNLYQEIKKDLLIARKDKNELVKSVLSVILSEADKSLISRLPENEQQDLMLNVVLKAEKQYIKAIEQFKDKKELVEGYQKELEVLSKYLPNQLSDEEIDEIIEELGEGNMGFVMKHFAQNYKGLYNLLKVRCAFENYYNKVRYENVNKCIDY
jgi:conserved hypothetical protein|nr:MAG TPA: YqeY-like protein [Herelleviridae sp.]